MLKIKFKKKVSLEEGAIAAVHPVWDTLEFRQLRKMIESGSKKYLPINFLVSDLYNKYLKDADEKEKDLFKKYLESHGLRLKSLVDGGIEEDEVVLSYDERGFDSVADEVFELFQTIKVPDNNELLKRIERKKLAKKLQGYGIGVWFWPESKNIRSIHELRFYGFTKEGAPPSREGRFRLYYENGNLMKAGTHGPNQSKEGEWQIYRKDGSLSASAMYKNNLNHGYFKGYHVDGKSIQFTTPYFEGKAHGITRFYNQNGNVEGITYHLNGLSVDRYEYMEHCRDNPEDPACKKPETPEEANDAQN